MTPHIGEDIIIIINLLCWCFISCLLLKLELQIINDLFLNEFKNTEYIT